MESNSLTKNLNKVVEDPIKENGTWIFSNIECKEDKKVCYTWTSLFQEFQDKKFVVLLHNDAGNELSKEIYKNINKSGLHRAA
jgi:ribosome-binding factor A